MRANTVKLNPDKVEVLIVNSLRSGVSSWPRRGCIPLEEVDMPVRGCSLIKHFYCLLEVMEDTGQEDQFLPSLAGEPAVTSPS